MEQRTRKLMTMHMAIRDSKEVDRLYVTRKEGGGGVVSIQHSIDASIQRLEKYIKKLGGRLVTAIRKNTRCIR